MGGRRRRDVNKSYTMDNGLSRRPAPRSSNGNNKTLTVLLCSFVLQRSSSAGRWSPSSGRWIFSHIVSIGFYSNNDHRDNIVIPIHI
ncbi:hypothetical protein QTP88_005754 [Uroleucon formosanum]